MILCYDVLIKNFRRVVAWMYLLLYKDRLEDLLRIRNVLREKVFRRAKFNPLNVFF